MRGFAFVAGLADVTEMFANEPVERAVERVLAGEAVSVFQNSDYGRAFREFGALHLESLTHRTTLVVLGDGRTNYQPPEDWVLEEARRRCKNVLWLCPEGRGTWGIGDSRMPTYARHADRVFVVRTLRDLSSAIDTLVL